MVLLLLFLFLSFFLVSLCLARCLELILVENRIARIETYVRTHQPCQGMTLLHDLLTRDEMTYSRKCIGLALAHQIELLKW